MSVSNKAKIDSTVASPAIAAAMMAINPSAAKAWMDISSESARFLTQRLQQDMEAQKAILACKSPKELMDVQSAFFRSAMEQYTDYITRFLTGMSAAAGQTATDAPTGNARRYDDVPI